MGHQREERKSTLVKREPLATVLGWYTSANPFFGNSDSTTTRTGTILESVLDLNLAFWVVGGSSDLAVQQFHQPVPDGLSSLDIAQMSILK